jgi:hypothetical protein
VHFSIALYIYRERENPQEMLVCAELRNNHPGLQFRPWYSEILNEFKKEEDHLKNVKGSYLY